VAPAEQAEIAEIAVGLHADDAHAGFHPRCLLKGVRVQLE
jgi:hypothetical protein